MTSAGSQVPGRSEATPEDFEKRAAKISVQYNVKVRVYCGVCVRDTKNDYQRQFVKCFNFKGYEKVH